MWDFFEVVLRYSVFVGVAIFLLNNQATITADISNIEKGLVQGVAGPVTQDILLFVVAGSVIALGFWVIQRDIAGPEERKNLRAPEFHAPTPSYGIKSSVGFNGSRPTVSAGAEGGSHRRKRSYYRR